MTFDELLTAMDGVATKHSDRITNEVNHELQQSSCPDIVAAMIHLHKKMSDNHMVVVKQLELILQRRARDELMRADKN